MLRGFRFARRRDPGKFEDLASSSLLLPVRGFLLPLLHLLLLRLVCEQERIRQFYRDVFGFGFGVLLESSLCGGATSVTLLRRSARSRSV